MLADFDPKIDITNDITNILLPNIDMTVLELYLYYTYTAHGCVHAKTLNPNKNCKENKNHIQVAKYCCKEHQIKDWNIRHKTHCHHIITIQLSVSNESLHSNDIKHVLFAVKDNYMY